MYLYDTSTMLLAPLKKRADGFLLPWIVDIWIRIFVLVWIKSMTN